MYLLFLPKTSLWHPPTSKKNLSQKGGASLISAFIVFMFSFFGLSLIFLSHIHLNVSAAKKNTTMLEYAAENGIKKGLDQFLDLLSNIRTPSLLSADDFESFRENVQKEESRFIREPLGLNLPLSTAESREHQIWKSSTQITLGELMDKEKYVLSEYSVSINSKGIITNHNQKRESCLSGSLGIFTGYLPLSVFPFLIDKHMDSEDIEHFTKTNKVSFFQSTANRLPQKLLFSEKKLIPEDVPEELGKAFKVKLFQPQNLSNAQLRFFLGLDATDDPIPEGAYLIKDDLGLGGIYVEGDIKEMVLAIDHEFQSICFRMEKGTWILEYSPSMRKTFFTTPEKTESFDLVPRGIIIISGKVRSLGGGVVDSSGKISMVKEEAASILRGVHLLIISSDTITISSHLIRQGIEHQKGMPYIKKPDPQLVLHSTGKSFWDKTDKEGGIVIDENSPDTIRIEAALTASGRGFSLEGKGKSVDLVGSLQASEYTSFGNRLNITSDEHSLLTHALPYDVPTTKEPVLYISYFRLTGWEEQR